MLNQAWTPGYLSIFLFGSFPLSPVSGPQVKRIYHYHLSELSNSKKSNVNMNSQLLNIVVIVQ